MSRPLKGFITYAHKNTTAKDELIMRLAVMQQRNELVTWHDAEMTGGDKWRKEIFKHLADSDILLYLVSAASLASENCNKELAEAVSSDIRIIPIILEHCDWKHHQLSDFQAFPDKGKPINAWPSEDEGWQNVVDGIRKVVEEMQTDVQKGTLPEWVFQQGNFLLMLRQTDKAIEAYSHAIELNPNNVFAYNNRGLVYAKKGDYKRAIKDLNKAIELDPNYVEAYNNRGIAFEGEGDFDRAIADHSTAIKLNSDYAEAYNNRGIAYDRKGDYDYAIRDYTTAIDLKPDYAGAYNNRGNAYRNKCNCDQAIDDLNMAIKLNSKFTEAYNNRGIAYDKKGEYDLAIEDYNEAIKLNPALALVFNNRGNTYHKKDCFTQAIKDLTKAIKLNSNYAEAYFNRGNIYRDKGEVDQSIANYTNAIELKSDYADAYYNRANAYLGKRDYDRAIKDYTIVTKFKPKFAEPYVNRGLAYRMLGRLDLAIKDYNLAIKLDPGDADAYNNRGVAYLNRSDFDHAIQDFNTATRLKPDLVSVYVNRGLAYLSKNEVNQAIDDYNTAIRLDSKLAPAYYNRGVAWLRLREWQKAELDLTAARDLGLDIIAAFHNTHKNVEAYERANRVKLPEDIAARLTQRRRSRYPKTQEPLSTDGTPLESPDVLNLLAKLRDAGPPLSQYVPMWPTFGIRTGASGAFVVDSATRDQLIAEHPSSANILKPFLHGRDIRRWGIAKPDTWLIFAYRRIEIDHYPAIRKHLEKYKSALSRRAGKQKWYELPAAKSNAEHFAQTKLICPNSYDHQTFAVDTDSFYCGDTCYLIPTEETWLCGLLNSRVVEWFYSQTSNQLSGDYLRARSRYMQQIPVPDLTPTQKSLIGKIVDYLIYLQGQPTTSGVDLAHARDFIMLGYFERVIDGLVYESYLREALHQGKKQFFKPLFDERLPQLEEIRGDKMAALREIFERLYERTHPIRRNLFFLDSVKPIRIIEGKA